MQEPPEEIYATSVYLQRLDATGERLFGEDGLKLMPILPDTFEFSQRIMNMIPDGEQGVYMLWWVDGFDSTQYNGVFVRRIAANSAPVWDTKKLTDRDKQYIPYLDNNLNLNLYEYPGETNPPGQRPDRFLKIDKSNGKIISQREIEIGTGEHGFSAFYDHVQSNDGSAIFAFHDFRDDTLRAQKLDGDSNKLWGDEPVILAHNLEGTTLFEIDSDKLDGAYLWYLTMDTTLVLLHLDGSGSLEWKKEFKLKSGEASVKIYDILGREVIMLYKQKTFTGRHAIRWNGKNHRGQDGRAGRI